MLIVVLAILAVLAYHKQESATGDKKPEEKTSEQKRMVDQPATLGKANPPPPAVEIDKKPEEKDKKPAEFEKDPTESNETEAADPTEALYTDKQAPTEAPSTDEKDKKQTVDSTETNDDDDIHVLVSDPEKLDAIRQRESDITKERIQKILATEASVILTTGGIDDQCLKYFTEGGAMAVRRCKKADLKRIAKTTGGQLVLTMANLERKESFETNNLGQVDERIYDDELILIKGESDITKERIQKILATETSVILTTGGIDDLCLKYFIDGGAMAVRRCKNADLKRIAKATGGQLVLTMANLERKESFEARNLGQANEVLQKRIYDDELILIKGKSDITKERIQKILATETSVILTTGGIDDLCLKYFIEGGALAVRRCKNADLKRIANVTGGQLVLTMANLERKESFEARNLGQANEVLQKRIYDDELILIKGKSDITKERIQKILATETSVILTTGGIDDLCLKYFIESGALAVRRCKNADLKRIAKATGGQLLLTMANLERKESFEASNLGQAEKIVQQQVPTEPASTDENYKKTSDFTKSKTNDNDDIQVLVSDSEKLDAIRQRESDITKEQIQKILATEASVILTTGGIDDLCLKYFTEGGTMDVRRCKKADLKRIANVTGGQLVLTMANLERKESFETNNLGQVDERIYDDELILIKGESDITKERIQKILATEASVILTTGGIDDLCLKYFTEGGAMDVRRCKKADLKRIANVTGAKLVLTMENLEGEESFEASNLIQSDKVLEDRICDDELPDTEYRPMYEILKLLFPVLCLCVICVIMCLCVIMCKVKNTPQKMAKIAYVINARPHRTYKGLEPRHGLWLKCKIRDNYIMLQGRWKTFHSKLDTGNPNTSVMSNVVAEKLGLHVTPYPEPYRQCDFILYPSHERYRDLIGKVTVDLKLKNDRVITVDFDVYTLPPTIAERHDYPLLSNLDILNNELMFLNRDVGVFLPDQPTPPRLIPDVPPVVVNPPMEEVCKEFGAELGTLSFTDRKKFYRNKLKRADRGKQFLAFCSEYVASVTRNNVAVDYYAEGSGHTLRVRPTVHFPREPRTRPAKRPLDLTDDDDDAQPAARRRYRYNPATRDLTTDMTVPGLMMRVPARSRKLVVKSYLDAPISDDRKLVGFLYDYRP